MDLGTAITGGIIGGAALVTLVLYVGVETGSRYGTDSVMWCIEEAEEGSEYACNERWDEETDEVYRVQRDVEDAKDMWRWNTGQKRQTATISATATPTLVVATATATPTVTATPTMESPTHIPTPIPPAPTPIAPTVTPLPACHIPGAPSNWYRTGEDTCAKRE